MTEIEKREIEIENYRATVDELLEQVEALSARCNFAESRLQKYDGIEETLAQLESDYNDLVEYSNHLEEEIKHANQREADLKKTLKDTTAELEKAYRRANAWKKVVKLELFDF